MKKKYYLTLDTETATLPFVGEYASSEKMRKNIAIAKPLVYDIGWTISDRNGDIVERKNFLVQETFFVPQIFNTAYYKEKRPLYMQMLADGKIEIATWNDIIEKHLIPALLKCDLATAYNACFDFKKAIPFTERYITALYSDWYNEWEERQRIAVQNIATGGKGGENEDYLNPICTIRNIDFEVADLWSLACERLVNNQRYKNFCLDNKLLTASGTYFKTSAETTFQYLTKDIDFIEQHTALDDAEIETIILTKILKKGKIEPTLAAFPFRELGETHEYVMNKKKYIPVVIEAIKIYLAGLVAQSKYSMRLENILTKLEYCLEEIEE